MNDSAHAEQLESRLRQVEVEKSGSYDKRTEHLDDEGNAIFINRLILEDSPYLLQHAHNPVNWYAWGTEAFETARVENKPVFLSIGYSTCHWCHVMEVESFDNEEVATVLNKDFISIKMDREQYPDIDEVYMTGVQFMSGQGGWPMSNFLLADGKPFFGATYFPPTTFVKLLQQIVEAWGNKYSELENTANSIDEAIGRILSASKEAVALDSEGVKKTIAALYQREDRSMGGLSGAPKFPQEPLLLFMLDRASRSRDVSAIGFVERALEGMGRGGIYDHVAGGFHRYSVDDRWLVPHFEKMLYNQSQLGLVYLQAYQLTGNTFFRRICQQSLNYVVRDMQVPVGGFYSATDADSEGAEGVFFLWDIDQLQEVLNEQEVELVISLYGVTEAGNFEGSNILHLSKSLQDHKEERGEDLIDNLDQILEKLYRARERRIHPLRDDKLIVGWTGAMITTLTKAAFHFDNQVWLLAAEKAAQFVYAQNVDSKGKLLRIYLNETSSIDGQLEDYVNFIQALITLFDVTSNRDYLNQAVQLMDVAVREFWDVEQGGFFLSPQNQIGPQLTRSRSASDGATLSAVATALECLVMLLDRSILINEESSELHYREKIDACSASLAASINDNSMSHTSLLRAIANYKQGSTGAIQYAGRGLAKIVAKKSEFDSNEQVKIEFTVSIEDGWHVTAPQAARDSFVPIEVQLAGEETQWQLQSINFPASTGVIRDTDGSEISIYENEIVISTTIKRNQSPGDSLSTSVGLVLRLQLCNQESCLLPSTLYIRT